MAGLKYILEKDKVIRMQITEILKIVFPALMVLGALGSAIVNVISKGDNPTTLQWIGAALLYTALMLRNRA